MDSIALYEQKLHQTINTILGIDGVLEKTHYSNTQIEILHAWLVGFFINDYEKYLSKNALPFDRRNLQITTQLVSEGMSNISVEVLNQYKTFYTKYLELYQFVPVSYCITQKINTQSRLGLNIEILFDRFEVGHFFILSKMLSSIKKAFYEITIIQNAWSVPIFKENIDNYYFEQNGPEYDLEEAIEQMAKTALTQIGL
ncbi:hypothetical protein [Cellulophaga sp. BC115SP]|uniref:hypothetical protein n=1 Tax=Cellulophaga sp. BC115SP TaxID=2683263 RepID=UPI0014136232|nr:hypothetical protein [Cellulophaga sp. BC115SP]NBB27239.1 hypothetical protein [Cellulophaga sp. BC115SP]